MSLPENIHKLLAALPKEERDIIVRYPVEHQEHLMIDFDLGNVYVKCPSVKVAVKAVASLHGHRFAGHPVLCHLVCTKCT